MLDKNLAELYGVQTKRINEVVKNNADKFPEDFYFQTTEDEAKFLRSKFSTLEIGRGKHTKYNPKVFTKQGIYMLATILKSKTSTNVTLNIIRTFLVQNALMFEKIDTLFKALEHKNPNQVILYNGHIFDAHNFISQLIRSAKKKIILTDNYIDDNTLTLFSKNQNADIDIYTHGISKTLKTELRKKNDKKIFRPDKNTLLSSS